MKIRKVKIIEGLLHINSVGDAMIVDQDESEYIDDLIKEYDKKNVKITIEEL